MYLFIEMLSKKTDLLAQTTRNRANNIFYFFRRYRVIYEKSRDIGSQGHMTAHLMS